MRKLIACALLAASSFAPVRAANVGNSCSTHWSGSGVCSFLLTGTTVKAYGVAASRSPRNDSTTGAPTGMKTPYLTLEVVWRHAEPGGAIIDTILLSCAAPASAGIPAVACSGSVTPKLDVGTPLLCTVRGRDTGAIACASPDVTLPSP